MGRSLMNRGRSLSCGESSAKSGGLTDSPECCREAEAAAKTERRPARPGAVFCLGSGGRVILRPDFFVPFDMSILSSITSFLRTNSTTNESPHHTRTILIDRKSE